MKCKGRKQKFIGVTLIMISIISAVVTDGDITFLMVFLPLGIYITVTDGNFVIETEAEETEAECAEIEVYEIRAENIKEQDI